MTTTASQAHRTTKNPPSPAPGRAAKASASIKATLEAKRAALKDVGWHPCLWCGTTIPEARVKNAILRNQVPKYCSEPCRLNDPSCSLVNRMYGAALGASVDDENAWRAVFDARLSLATTPAPKPPRKGTKNAR